MEMKITAESPVVMLKPYPESKDYLIVNLGKITLENRTIKEP